MDAYYAALLVLVAIVVILFGAFLLVLRNYRQENRDLNRLLREREKSVLNFEQLFTEARSLNVKLKDELGAIRDAEVAKMPIEQGNAVYVVGSKVAWTVERLRTDEMLLVRFEGGQAIRETFPTKLIRRIP
jgi:hypothetical protein